jgi:predicted dehydrogenase
MSKLRVGVIGAGGIAAKLHLPEMQQVADAEVVVLAGRKQSRLETLCRQFNVPRFTTSYDEVISDPNIDAVIVAVPHPLHVQYGLAALHAGKHVHIQKPLSTSLEEADEFVKAVELTDRTVLALPYVARPNILEARDWVRSGKLGKTSSAHSRFSHGGPEVYYATIQTLLNEQPEDDLWFFDATKADVGALFDMGVYSIAHLCAVLGSVTHVMCHCTTVAKPTTLEDTAALILSFKSGVLGTAETGWCDGARTFEFSVHGTTGKLVNPSLTGDLNYLRPSSVVDEDAPLIEEPVNLKKWPVENSHQHWARCIREHKQPEIANARFARHVTEIMLKGLDSSRTGSRVAIQSRID